jgi:serpin B
MLHRALVIAFVVLAIAGCGSHSSPVSTSASAGEIRASVPRAPATAPRADAAALRAGDAIFAGRLLGLLARTEPTVALSPYSISETLAMTFSGARGETASQIARTLDFQLPPARLQAAFNALDRALASATAAGTDLRLANALYAQRGMRLRRAFLRVLARYYGAGVRTVDFAVAPDAARAAINAWVSERTVGKIPQLLSSHDVNGMTRLALINALYLNAKWSSPFDKHDTAAAPFYAPSGTVQVPTMHQTGTFGYLARPGYRALELPYRDGRLAFDILLPDQGGLPSLLRRLRRGNPLGLVTGLAARRVQLALPKLALRTHFELADTLKALGMPLAFDRGRADLSGIAGRPGDLYLGAVAHAAYIRVDEAGTEAAAATAAVVSVTAVAPLPTIPFNVDRPFAFILRDRGTGAILFAGAVSRP